MDENKDAVLEEKKKQAYQAGLAVFILLIVFSIGEFAMGYFASAWWVPLLGVATLKAFLVIRDYMHAGRLFSSDEEVH
jgi:hypothetical protein